VCFCSCLYRFLFKKSDIFNVIEPLRKNETQKKKKRKDIVFFFFFFCVSIKIGKVVINEQEKKQKRQRKQLTRTP